MALVYRFDGAGHGHSTYRPADGMRLRDCISAEWEQYIILKKGEKISPDYIPAEDDIIFMRRLPKGMTASIIMAVVAVGVAVAVGIYAYSKQKEINDKQQELEENQKKLSSGSQIQKLPYVKGASNASATGQSFPYIIGQTLFTPYKLCPDHVTISGTDGTDLYYHLVLDCGFSTLSLKKLMLGSNTILTWPDGTIQEGQYVFEQGTYYDPENIVEIRQTGDFTENEFNRKVVFSNYMEEIPHRHIGSDSSQSEAQEIEDEWRAGLVKQLPDHVMSVEVIILFDGLRKFDSDNGTWVSASLTLQVQWTNADNPSESDWHDFDTGFDQNGTVSNRFTRNVRRQMRFAATQTFTPSQAYNKNISVRVRRTTPKAESNAKDTVYLMAVQSVIFDQKKSSSDNLVPALPLEENLRDKCTRMGIKIKSTSATDGYMDKFSVVECGCARTWNSETGEWSLSRTPTRNLAAWVLEILTSPVHAPSKYEDSEIDLDSFGEWYEYCEEEGIYADGAVTSTVSKKNLLETLVGNGHAMLVLNEMTGLLEVLVDSGRDYSVGLLTPDNIISLSAVKSVRRTTDGIKVTYINGAAGYESDSVVFMRDGEEYDPQTDSLSTTALSYVTDYTQTFRLAWRHMAEEIAHPVTATVKVGQCGGFYRVFDCINLQTPTLSIGLGHGVIKSLFWQNGTLRAIELAGYVDFPESGSCGVIINCTTTPGILELRVEGAGRTSTLAVLDVISESDKKIPSVGDTLSFGLLEDGSFSRVTTKMLIVGSEPADEGYTLTLVEYNPAVYSRGSLPEYKSNITARPDSTILKLQDVREYATPSDVGEAIGRMEAGTAEVSNPDTPAGLTAVATRDSVELRWNPLGLGLKNTVQYYSVQVSFDSGTTWNDAGRSKTNGFSFAIERTGKNYPGFPEAADFLPWRFRVEATSIYGKVSGFCDPPAEVKAAPSVYGTWKLGAPVIEASEDGRFITLTMAQPPRSDGRMQYGTIRYGILIRRPDTDEPGVWWTPATDKDPVADVDGYRADTHTPLERDSPYIQRLPLLSAQEGGLKMTSYQFRVTSINEAGTDEAKYTDITVTANFDNIRDFVKANLTEKNAIVEELSAISANLGEITGGKMNGGLNNFWTLATALNPHPGPGNRDYQGAFRVGGDKEYLQVTPILNPYTHEIISYTIEFHVGNFSVTSEASEINGEMVVQSSSSALERARITPGGIYFETRPDSSSSAWTEIVHQSKTGTVTPSVQTNGNQANGSLVITNATMLQRRRSGSDIGIPLPAPDAKVYHFDTDFLDQEGGATVEISYTSGDVEPVLVGEDDTPDPDSGIESFAPALLAIAPYATSSKSIYGNFSLSKTFAPSNEWQLDYWMKYIWNESQTLFSIGEDGHYVSLRILDSEPYYNTPLDGEPEYNNETASSVLIPYNTILNKRTVVEYVHGTTVESVLLETEGVLFDVDKWYHIGVLCSDKTISVLIGTRRFLFTQAANFASEMTLSVNPSEGLMCVDELMVSPTVCGNWTDFIRNTSDRIPWGALDYRRKHFVLDVDGSDVWTNLFECGAFTDALFAYMHTQAFVDRITEITENRGE